MAAIELFYLSAAKVSWQTLLPEEKRDERAQLARSWGAASSFFGHDPFNEEFLSFWR